MSFFEEFLKELAALGTIPQPIIEYRLHYDEDGRIYLCSQYGHPENTTYLVVDRETYDNYSKYYVKNNSLKLLDDSAGNRVKLIRSTQGYKTVKNHAGIILEPNENYADIEFYDDTVN